MQEAAKHAADFGRSEVDTEHLLLALADSDVIKTILSQFKIKVDDLKRQIEAEVSAATSRSKARSACRHG